MDDFILFSSGEESGDILGEAAVKAAIQSGMRARGLGGARMKREGLEEVIPFEKLPVSGFLDIFPRLPFFLSLKKKMIRLLREPSCKAFFAIDYPGFNLSLAKWAKKWRKPVYFLSPPQVFAWNASRIKKLSNMTLGSFFPMERNFLAERGLFPQSLIHPFVEAISEASPVEDFSADEISQTFPAENFPASDSLKNSPEKKRKILFLPGSRRANAQRNFPLYLCAASVLQKNFDCVFVFPDAPWIRSFEKSSLNFPIIPAKKTLSERAQLFQSAYLIVSSPGTALLESTLCATPSIAWTRPDFFTYLLAPHLIKIPYLSLPSLILNRKILPEIFVSPWENKKAATQKFLSEIQNLNDSILEEAKQNAIILKEKLSVGKTIFDSSFEFFQQLRFRQP